MKKQILSFSVLCVIVLSGVILLNKDSIVKDNRQVPKRVKCQTASTSPSYLTAGSASTTCYAFIASAENVDLNLILTASSTATKFQWTNFFSYDGEDVADSADRNWFPEKSYIAEQGKRTYNASNVINYLTPADDIASSTYHNVGIDDFRERWIKIEYALSGDNGAVYLEIIKEETN